MKRASGGQAASMHDLEGRNGMYEFKRRQLRPDLCSGDFDPLETGSLSLEPGP